MPIATTTPIPATAVHPHDRPSRTATPLSILDSALAELTPTAATWFFNSPLDAALLKESLEHTLSAYPFLCGRLTLAPSEMDTDTNPVTPSDLASAPAHSGRFGRVWVVFGDADPGVLFTVSDVSEPLDSVLPTPTKSGWDTTQTSTLIAPALGGLVHLRPRTRGHAAVVHLTRFPDGAALSFAAHHSLLDAQAAAGFMRHWAAVHRALVKKQPLPQSPAVWDPLALDAYAAGDIDSPNADPAVVALAEKIPQLHLDFWHPDSAHGPDYVAAVRAKPPSAALDALDAAQGRGRGRPAPWDTCDPGAVVLDRAVDFSPNDIAALYGVGTDTAGGVDTATDVTSAMNGADRGANGTHATKTDANNNGAADANCTDVAHENRNPRNSSPTPVPRLSRLDTVLAAVWRAIVRARDLPETRVGLHYCRGVRRRVDPPLPASFVGAALVNVSAFATSTQLSRNGSDRYRLKHAAREIRRGVASVDSTTVPAILHTMAHGLDPVREWNAFIGEENVLATSWLDIGAYDVDFGLGTPVLVHAFMPPVDGLVVAMEVPGSEGEGRWYKAGVRVRMLLREGVMGRVLDELAAWKGE